MSVGGGGAPASLRRGSEGGWGLEEEVGGLVEGEVAVGCYLGEWVGGGYSDYCGSGTTSGFESGEGIFEDEALGGGNAEALGCEEVSLWVGFGACDVGIGDYYVDHFPEYGLLAEEFAHFGGVAAGDDGYALSGVAEPGEEVFDAGEELVAHGAFLLFDVVDDYGVEFGLEVGVEDVLEGVSFDYECEVGYACWEFLFELLPECGVDALGVYEYAVEVEEYG